MPVICYFVNLICYYKLLKPASLCKIHAHSQTTCILFQFSCYKIYSTYENHIQGCVTMSKNGLQSTVSISLGRIPMFSLQQQRIALLTFTSTRIKQWKHTTGLIPPPKKKLGPNPTVGKLIGPHDRRPGTCVKPICTKLIGCSCMFQAVNPPRRISESDDFTVTSPSGRRPINCFGCLVEITGQNEGRNSHT